MPQNLCTAFSETRQFPMLSTTYHDGTTERSLIQDGVNVPASIRTWKLTERLTATQLQAMKTFYEGQSGGLVPFFWYNPFEPMSGQPIGSNYDSTGVSTQGRHSVVFRGNWSETVSISLTDTPLEIAKIA
jgi:hypothetical protein